MGEIHQAGATGTLLGQEDSLLREENILQDQDTSLPAGKILLDIQGQGMSLLQSSGTGTLGGMSVRT